LYKIQPKTLFLGRNVIYLPSCHSTNDSALEIIQFNPPTEGTVVITDNQTAGRGQRGASWEATSHQNLTFSLILYPTFISAHQQFKLNQAISLGINAFLRKKGIQDAWVKWPNDMYVGEKKIGGILIENSLYGSTLKTSIVGIGLNIKQLSFENPKATSLALVLQQFDISLSVCLEEVIEEIDRYYQLVADTSNWALIHQLYESHLLGIGQKRDYLDESGNRFRGVIRGVHPAGLLQIEREDGTLQLFDLKQVAFCFQDE
jgi:BirA family biotin operon repressor/biotin-[acetyl-CoA-carboxylase] ligase